MIKAGNSRSSRIDTQLGSALIITVMTVAVLCLIVGTLLSFTSSKQSGPFQAASWHEAGSAAEGGVEIALNALRRSINEGAAAWSGWDAAPSVGVTAKQYITSDDLLGHAGEGNNVVRAIIEISSPSGNGTINPPSISSNRYAYLIRSTGLALVPGPTRLATEKGDLNLRKINVFRDMRTGNAITPVNGKVLPQVTRVVEAIAGPVMPFQSAILSKEQIEIKSGKNMVVDSYDPTIAPYKYPIPTTFPYNVATSGHRPNGNVATNLKKKSHEDVIRLENVVVNGMAAKGSGLVNIKTNASVKGAVVDGFYEELKPVLSPKNNAGFTPIDTTNALTALDRPKKKVEIETGRPGDPPKYYKFSKLHLHDKDSLRIKQGSGGNGGSAEIYVTGDIVIHKGGYIQVDNGVNVTFYVEKNVTLEEKDASKPAIRNLNIYPTNADGTGGIAWDPSTLQIYGVVADKKKKHFKIKTDMAALVHAPDHEFEIKLKANRHVYGALSGRKFKVEGETQIHYDEAAGDKGKPFDYTLESWQEDWFDPKVRVTGGP